MAKTFVAKRAADINPSTSTATVFLQAVGDTTKAVFLAIPAGALKFKVRAGGVATGGTTTNFTPTVQIGNKTTAASNTNLGGLTAAAFNSASGMWSLDLDCVYDATNNTIRGIKAGQSGSSSAMETVAVITAVTTQDLSKSGTYLSINGLFSAANASNKSTLDYFSLEVLESNK